MQILTSYRIRLIADVRLLPGSRRYPHFDQQALSAALRETGIAYAHFPELGGRRKPRPNSRNLRWRNAAFRGYADHMETTEFAAGLLRLEKVDAGGGPSALMCAEAVWWRCHRALIADFLQANGSEVIHIISARSSRMHPFTSAARLVNGSLSYSDEENLC